MFLFVHTVQMSHNKITYMQQRRKTPHWARVNIFHITIMIPRPVWAFAGTQIMLLAVPCARSLHNFWSKALLYEATLWLHWSYFLNPVLAVLGHLPRVYIVDNAGFTGYAYNNLQYFSVIWCRSSGRWFEPNFKIRIPWHYDQKYVDRSQY